MLLGFTLDLLQGHFRGVPFVAAIARRLCDVAFCIDIELYVFVGENFDGHIIRIYSAARGCETALERWWLYECIY